MSAYFASEIFFFPYISLSISILQCMIVTITYPQGKQQWKHYLRIYALLAKEINHIFPTKIMRQSSKPLMLMNDYSI